MKAFELIESDKTFAALAVASDHSLFAKFADRHLYIFAITNVIAREGTRPAIARIRQLAQAKTDSKHLYQHDTALALYLLALYEVQLWRARWMAWRISRRLNVRWVPPRLLDK